MTIQITVFIVGLALFFALRARTLRARSKIAPLAAEIQKDFLDSAHVLISDDRTPDSVVELAYRCLNITHYWMVCIGWLAARFSKKRSSQPSEFYERVDREMTEMPDDLLLQFEKLIGSMIMYSTLRAGFLGTLVRAFAAPYVHREKREYKGASSGVDLAVAFTAVRPQY